MPQFIALANGIRVRLSAITNYSPEGCNGIGFQCKISGIQFLFLDKYFGPHLDGPNEVPEQDAKVDSFGDGIEVPTANSQSGTFTSRQIEGIDPSVAQDIPGRPVLTAYPKRRRSGRRR